MWATVAALFLLLSACGNEETGDPQSQPAASTPQTDRSSDIDQLAAALRGAPAEVRPNPDEANCIATAMIENGDAPANDAPAGPLSISDETTAAIADCVDAKQWLERLLTPGVGDETASCVAEATPPDVAFDVAVSPFLTGAEIVSASQAAYTQALELCGLSTAAVAVSTTAGEPSPLRAEAELAVAARLAADAPGSVTDEQIACVASATVEALDEERLSEIVAALDGPSTAVLPAGIVSDLERDRIVDAAAGCLPWTQSILDSLQDLPDIPAAAVVECAQGAAPSVETDRLVADIALFGGEFVTVLNLVLPPDCLP